MTNEIDYIFEPNYPNWGDANKPKNITSRPAIVSAIDLPPILPPIRPPLFAEPGEPDTACSECGSSDNLYFIRLFNRCYGCWKAHRERGLLNVDFTTVLLDFSRLSPEKSGKFFERISAMKLRGHADFENVIFNPGPIQKKIRVDPRPPKE